MSNNSLTPDLVPVIYQPYPNTGAGDTLPEGGIKINANDEALRRAIAALEAGQVSGTNIGAYATLADLQADAAASSAPEHSTALVTNDNDVSKIGLYRKDDSGTWVLMADRFAGLLGSSFVGFSQAGPGSVLRTVQSKARERVSVKDFGAVGDGLKDDTNAFEACLAFIKTLGTSGGCIYVPSGKYLIKRTLQLSRYCMLRGDGPLASYLIADHADDIIQYGLGAWSATGASIRDLSLEKTGDFAYTGFGVKVSDTFGFKMENLEIQKCDFGICLSNRYGWTEGTIIRDVHISQTANGLTFRSDPQASSATTSYGYTRIENVSVSFASSQRTGAIGLQLGVIGDGHGGHVYNCHFGMNIWGKNGTTTISFAKNYYISNSVGYFLNESSGHDASILVYQEEYSQKCGFHGQRPSLVDSPAEYDYHDQSFQMISSDLGTTKVRGNNISGSSTQWVLAVKMNSLEGFFIGTMRAAGEYGTTTHLRGKTTQCRFGMSKYAVQGGFVTWDRIGEALGNKLRVYENPSDGSYEVWMSAAPYCANWLCEYNTPVLPQFHPDVIEVWRPAANGALPTDENPDLVLKWDSDDHEV